jgi:DNA-binding GntR family transcriptional regulator
MSVQPATKPVSPSFESAVPTIADRLSDTLLAAIVQGELPAGSKINEPVLARSYKVSRGPLREAIRRLEGMHLVTRVPHLGARVVTLDPERLGEIYCLREALEGMAARLAAHHMSDREIADIDMLLDKHERDIERAEGREYFQREGDFDFHYRIIQGSGNRLLMDMLCGELYHLIRMFRYRSSQMVSRPQRALTEHRNILAAIRDRDGELSEMLMRRHISNARRNMEQHFSQTENRA